MVGASSLDIKLSTGLYVDGTTTDYPYEPLSLPSYYSGNVQLVDNSEYEKLLGTKVPDGKWSGLLGENDAICQMYYAKSGLARFAYRRLTAMKKKADESGKPDLNIMFIYNMPFRAMAKMTQGAVSMEMVDGIVKLVNGHFFKGLGKIIGGYFRNSRKNRAYESMLKRAE